VSLSSAAVKLVHGRDDLLVEVRLRQLALTLLRRQRHRQCA
jgi:hypothetical protein